MAKRLLLADHSPISPRTSPALLHIREESGIPIGDIIQSARCDRLAFMADTEIWEAILEVAKGKAESTVFRVSEVRDLLRLPKNQGRNEPIRHFCRMNSEKLRREGLLFLVDYDRREYDPGRKGHQWFVLKQKRKKKLR